MNMTDIPWFCGEAPMWEGKLTPKWLFVSTAVLVQLAWNKCLCYPEMSSSLRVGIDSAPLHPNAPWKNQQSLGWKPCRSRAETQFASHESPFRCGLRKTGKTGKMNSLLLSPAMLKQRFPARIHLCFKGRTSRMCMQEALPLQWVYMG